MDVKVEVNLVIEEYNECPHMSFYTVRKMGYSVIFLKVI